MHKVTFYFEDGTEGQYYMVSRMMPSADDFSASRSRNTAHKYGGSMPDKVFTAFKIEQMTPQERAQINSGFLIAEKNKFGRLQCIR